MKNKGDTLVVCVGVMLLIVAVSTLIGKRLDYPRLSAWDGGTPMADSTATCFLLIGLALMWICRQKDERKP